MTNDKFENCSSASSSLHNQYALIEHVVSFQSPGLNKTGVGESSITAVHVEKDMQVMILTTALLT